MNKNQCNICGANYEYRNGRWVCPACDAVKPEEITNEETTLLYVATQERQLMNFDEAERKYSDIIERYPKKAESYFGRVLSKYGIKYEKDYDGRNIPTCCATSLDSFLDDKDYLKALELADKENKRVYQEHAEYIEKIRAEWIEKAKKEEPYDVFISYKESEGLRRTEDSIAVQDLYIHLTEQGYRVFFSRESLRDKTGQNYEPYIFSALSTAKVMLVYASKPEYVMSIWLKNEWTRYVKRIKLGEKRDDSLLVACDGFSPKELPSVLAKKQCLDAKARSFYTDLDNRIKELVKNPKVERGSIRKYKVEKINVEELVPAKKQEIKQFDALHEHNFKKVQVVPPTCNSQGYTLFRCDCGEEKKTDFTPKRTSHEWQLAERKEPTCINNGYELYECKYCDATDKKILTAIGHDEFVAEEKEATCFEEGYRKYECKVCGHTRIESISKTNHDYGDWVITKHPTCVENGEETRQCKNCPDQQKRELPAKGHSFSKWVVKTEPTCDKEGIEHRQCKTCGKIEERSLPKRKHKFGAWQDSKDGMHKERLCEYCGKVDKVLTEEYIRQRNKKKARVLEIIAYALFAISGIAALVGTNIFFANCYDLRVFIYCSWWLLIPFFIGLACWVGAICVRKYIGTLTKINIIHYTKAGKVFSIILAVFLSCWSFVSLIFPSFKDTESGYDGFADGYYYTYTEDSSGVVLEECREELSGDIVIPAIVGGKKVAELGSYLFDSNDKITGVIISEGIKEISFRSFYGCNQLKAVSIPNSVIEVRDYAFEGCSNLEYYEKDGAYYLGNEINHYIYLAKVSQSASISIENGCKFIAEYSFANSSIKNIVIPNTVISIGKFAFSNCDYLESVTLQNGLKDIRFKAFANCDSLEGKTIVIPNSVEYIDEFIFYNSPLTIYCEAESEPDGWVWHWDYYSDNWKDVFSSQRCEVVWGYKG